MRPQRVSSLPLISASQISLFRECARKWAWRYIAKIQTPQHPSAALGTEVDDTQLQPYLRDGKPFDYTRDSGYIAAAGLAFLPKPMTPGLEVQKYFYLPSPASGGKFAYQGYMDLWLPDSSLVPDMPGGAPFVGDFKTTSDLKWAKSVAALSTDVQAMLYATDALFETGSDVVDLSWMYFQTRGPRKTKRTYLRVTSEHVIEQFKAIENTALELFDAKTNVTDPLSLPPSPSQCEAYGGCPFRDKCNLSPTDHLAALAARDSVFNEVQKGLGMSGNSTSSLMANLQAKKARAQGAATAAAPAAAPLPPPEQPTLEAHVAANPRAAFLTAPAADKGTGIVGKREDGSNVYAWEQGKQALGINPPEKDVVPTVTEAAPAKRPGRPKKSAVAAPAPEVALAEPKQLPLFDAVDVPVDKVRYVTEELARAIVDEIAARLGAK